VISQVHESARGLWILLVALVFFALYGGIAYFLLQGGWRIPGGVFAATAVTFVPVGGVGLERLVGISGQHQLGTDVILGGGETGPLPVSSSFHGASFALAVATVVAGLVVYSLVRYSFVFAWVSVATLVALQIFLGAVVSHPGLRDRADAFIVTGVVFVAIGLNADLLRARSAAFWWHLVGLWSIAIGLGYHAGSHSSPGWIFVLLAGAVALLASAPLHRATWAVFGLLGLYSPFFHYSDRWFGNLGTAFALTVVGLAIVALGMAVQSSGDSWAAMIARRARPKTV